MERLKVATIRPLTEWDKELKPLSLHAYVYEMYRRQEKEKFIDKVLCNINEIEAKGFKPKYILLGKKAAETVIMKVYSITGGINMETLFGLDVIVDGSDDSYSYKVICDNQTELFSTLHKTV